MGYVRRRKTSSGFRYYPTVGNRTFGGFARKKDAEARLRQVESELAAGTLDRPRFRFDEFADRWLDYKSRMVRTSSFRAYEVQTDHLKKHLSPYYMDEITHLVVSEMTRTLAGKYAPRTVNHILSVLNGLMTYAVKVEVLDSAPRIEKVRVPHSEQRFLNQEEVEVLLKSPNRDLYMTALLTGMRLGELRALRWSDYSGRTILVSRSYGKHGLGPTKSGRSRIVHVSPALQQVLDSRPREFDLVFSENGQPLGGIYHRYKKDGGPGPFHSMRHTYAALMLAAGANVKYLQEQMGHASIQTTLDLYGHLIPEFHTNALKRLDSLLLDETVVPLRRAGDGQGEASPFGL